MNENIQTLERQSINSIVLEYAILFLLGIIAIVIHAKMRIPMRLPGHHGVEFMMLMMSGRVISKQKYASSFFSLGVASMIFLPFMGFHDPFMTLVYILPGFFIDFFYFKIFNANPKIWLIALLSGFAYALIPISRFLISSFTGFPYGSLLTGIWYPLTLHFLFGLSGGLAGLGVSKLFKSKF